MAAGDPQPYREALSNLACLLARNGGETRRPHREALCLGGVQQVLPVCTPMVIVVTTRADGDTVRRLLTSGSSRNGTLVPTWLLPGTPFPLRLNGSLAGGRQEPFASAS